MDHPDNEFEFDEFPPTDAISVIPPGTPASNDWEPAATVDLSGLASDPLKATFSDLDLAPARDEVLKDTDLDANYWAD